MAKYSKWKIVEGKERAATLALELARFNGGLDELTRREKYQRMADSPFAFYRGTAHLYYRDLAHRQMIEKSPFSSVDAITWIQGDLHLSNFGAFCDGEGDVVFDLNDFDEGWITSYLYDLWRGAASLVLTGLDNGLSEKKVTKCLDEFTHRYLQKIRQYHQTDRTSYDKVNIDNTHGPLHKFLSKAERLSRKTMLERWTVVDEDGRRFNTDEPKLARVNRDDDKLLRAAISNYKNHLESNLCGDKKHFKVKDTARRLGAGVGSFGTSRYYVLINGADNDPHSDRILDLKEQGLPSIYPFLSPTEQVNLTRQYPAALSGKRVIDCQRSMLRDPDRHLGYFTILGRCYSVRERSPYKKSLKVEKLTKNKDFFEMAHHWGTILANGHSRGDDAVKHGGVDSFEREVLRLTDGEEDVFCDEVRDFAFAYAAQTQVDFDIFCDLLGIDQSS